jgi:hypothetical protein
MNKGQYFTTNEQLKEKVVEFILNNPTTILEPSVGQGNLVFHIKMASGVTTMLLAIAG